MTLFFLGAFSVAVALAVWLWLLHSNATKEIARLKAQEDEHNRQAEYAEHVNAEITRHSDPDDAVDRLRSGRFGQI